MAGIRFDVRSNMREVLKDLEKHPKIVEQAAVSALNRVGQRAVTEVRRELAAKWGIPQKVFRGRVSYAKPYPGRVSTAVYLRHKKVNAMSIGGVKKVAQGKGGRARYHAVKGWRFYDSWLLEPGHVSAESGRVFPTGLLLQRKSGAKRYPTESAGVTIWPLAGTIARKTIDRVAAAEFEKRFRHEYERRIGRLK